MKIGDPGVIEVSTNGDGHTFARQGARRRCVFLAHERDRRPLTPGQVRAVADLLDVPTDQEVRFIDPVTEREVHV